MLQITRAVEAPLFVAVNCICAPGLSVAEEGDTLTADPATSDTVAEADADGSATAFALTVMLAGFGSAAGAVYRPPAEIVPQAAPVHPDPETLHATAVFVLPVTTAENCCCPPADTCVVFGKIETETEVADCTTNDAEADFVGSATE